MFRLRYFSRLLQTFLSRFRRLIFASTAIGFLLFLLMPRAQALFPFLARSQTIGVVGRFSLDQLPLEIQQQISLGLTTIDEEQAVAPGLAASWHHEDEGRVWIFELGDYKWQDGKALRSQDINYNFADVEVQVLDDTRIKFILKDPFAPFPSVVSRPVFRKGLLGAGDWKVTKLSLISGNFVESIRLKNVQDEETLTYRFYPTEEAARTAFKLGEARGLQGIIEPEDLGNWPNAQVEEVVRQDRYAGIFLNINDPQLTEKDLRQALAYATDKEALGSLRAISPISPASWAFNPQVKQYPYNLERAKQLLESLRDIEEISLNLVTTPTLLGVADKIKADWEAIGIETHLQVSNTPPVDFQALLAIQATTPDPDQYSLWHSTQGATNITNYGEQTEDKKPKESPRIDKLLEEGRTTLDKEERRKIYLDLQRFLVEDSPVIFLYHPSTYNIVRK